MHIDEHNTPVVDNAIIETLKELLERQKTMPAEKDRLGFLLNYFTDKRSTQLLKYRAAGQRYLSPNRSDYGDPEPVRKAERDNEDIMNDVMVRALQNKKIYRHTYYRKAYEGLRDTEVHKGWSDLITEIYEDDKALNEIFVRLVEEKEKTTIASAKALQEITGIHRLGYDKNFEKEEARRQMEHVFASAMRYRYERFLEEILDGGGKYSDLVRTDPAAFHLPESYREDAVREAIYNSFELGDTPPDMPDLTGIANAVGAPYEIILQSGRRHSAE